MSSKSGKNNTSKNKSNDKSKAKTSTLKKKRNSSEIKFDIYIKKVQTQVHPDLTLGNSSTIPIINDIIKYIISRIATESSALLRHTNKVVLSGVHIEAAVKIVYSGRLATEAIKRGVAAQTKFNASKENRESKGEKRNKAFRAGIQFGISRVSRFLYQNMKGERVGHGSSAGVFLAAIIEYTVSELLELAGNNTKDRKKVKIIPEDLIYAIRGDEELNALFPEKCIIQGGVIPYINKALIKKTKV